MLREKLLLIPGPTPVHPRIIHSLSLPTVSHVSPTMVEEMKEALFNLKKIVFCSGGEPFLVSGAGTLSMEMALVNILSKGESALVLSQGYFGLRMKEIADCFGIECDVIESEWGKAVLPDDLERKLAEKSYSAVFSTHVDTATGACAPVKTYAEVIGKKNPRPLYVIDGVCATGGIEENMDDWGVDVLLTAAQKCFGVPPGLAVIVFSERAMEKRQSMKAVNAYYADILRWLPIMKNPAKYFSTPCVNEIRAFNEGTRIILEEGLSVRFARHRKTAEAIREGLKALGFTFFTEREYLADTLSVVQYPEGLEDIAFRKTYFENGIIVAGGLGPAAGRVFRMGHMGNLSFAQVEYAIAALEMTLQSLGFPMTSGSGILAVKKVLEG